jgi:hypothetical protein
VNEVQRATVVAAMKIAGGTLNQARAALGSGSVAFDAAPLLSRGRRVSPLGPACKGDNEKPSCPLVFPCVGKAAKPGLTMWNIKMLKNIFAYSFG